MSVEERARLCLIGGGRMGHALVSGLLRSGWVGPPEIVIAERQADTRAELCERFPGVRIAQAPAAADSAVLAVKPADVAVACEAMAPRQFPRVVSIVAGVRIEELQRRLGASTAVLRAMPNMPAVLGRAASALAGGERAGEEDFSWAESVLSSFGVVARVPERLLDAVTGLSGSGPAYLFLLAEAMVEAGVEQGLDREVSRLFTHQTLLGASQLLMEFDETAEELRARVTSPGGTTSAAVHALERGRFRATVMDAVAAAAEHSRRLGEAREPS